MSLTLADSYIPFTDIGYAVMKILADTRGIKISETTRRNSKKDFSTMPPYPDVRLALPKLRAAGFKLFTLTNNLLGVQTRQLEHGGILDLFERSFSADSVKRHKPAPEVYAHVQKESYRCHTWDTLGAVAAGWEAALVKRAGNDVGVGPQP